MSATRTARLFPFRFDPRYRVINAAFGVTARRAEVELIDAHLIVRYGPWTVVTGIDNIASATVTGPYSVLKTIGPAHVSLRDRGLTFATNRDAGVCLELHEPVHGIDPFNLLLHPGLTVTVADPPALVDAIGDARQRAGVTHVRRVRDDRAPVAAFATI